MACEDPIDEIDQARPAERRIVRLAASGRDVDFVARRAEPLDRGARIRIPRVDAGHRFSFEFSRHGQRVRRGRRYTGVVEHLHKVPRVEVIDDVGVPARLPVGRVHPLHVRDPGLVVGAPPRIRIASETRRQELGESLAVSAKHLLVVEQDSIEIEEDAHRRVAELRGQDKRCGTGETAK